MKRHDENRVLVSDARWPLVVTHYPLRVNDLDLFLETFVASFERVLGRRAPAPWLHLADAGAMELYRATAVERQRIADMLEDCDRRLGAPIADAFVASNDAGRCIVTGITFLQNVGYPRRVFADASRAERWLLQVAQAHRISIPASGRGETSLVSGGVSQKR